MATVHELLVAAQPNDLESARAVVVAAVEQEGGVSAQVVTVLLGMQDDDRVFDEVVKLLDAAPSLFDGPLI